MKKVFCILAALAVVEMAAAQQPTRLFSVSKAVEKRVDSVLRLLTLEEKSRLVHAQSLFVSGDVPRLKIKGLVTTDGPHGVRMDLHPDFSPVAKGDDSVTYLPVGIALAATWNKSLGFQHGKVLGAEALHRGKDVVLGPGVNIIRTPLNGRNFEYLSEDPHLAAQMAIGYIRGVQSTGAAACVKHFIANNQETGRNWVNVEMSDRALHEIYLPAFKASVQEAGVMLVMGAYNKFRGEYCSHNNFLINKLLKKDWGFNGVLVSDWGAVHDTRQALLNGTDLEMGSELLPHVKRFDDFYLAEPALKAIRSGEVPDTVLDDKVQRILRLRYTLDEKKKVAQVNTPAHRRAATAIAEESMVLLKNHNNLLPFSPRRIRRLAVIGLNATQLHARGGGSSQVQALYEIPPLSALQKLARSHAIQVEYAQGYKVGRNQTTADESLLQEAMALASRADAVVFVGGTNHGYDYAKWDERAYDSEDVDRSDMKLPFAQPALIQALAKANPNLAVVLMGGSAVEMEEWIAAASAIVQVWYNGMEGGNALAGLLFGQVNPSGKLPVTFPKRLTDVGAHRLGEYPGDSTRLSYNEGIYVGYRFADKNNIEPQFPFGHGLSYTRFSMAPLQVRQQSGKITVRVQVRNTGRLAGKEVVQLYTGKKQSAVDRPVRELRAFEKVALRPGAAATVTFTLDRSAFAHYNESTAQWKVEPGTYQIMVGNSSRNILQTINVRL